MYRRKDYSETMKKSFGALLRDLDGPVMVTGHTGFKGTWLIRYLKALGIDAVGYSLPPRKDSLYSRCELNGTVNEHFGDIRTIDELNKFVQVTKPAVILHLAAQALVTESYLDPIGTFETNVIGTANVLQVAKNSPGIQAVGVITTDKVYKNQNLGNRFREEDPLLGADPYSASKAACENVIEAWRNIPSSHQEFPIVSLRAGNVIGGGDLSQNRLIPDLVRGFQNITKVTIRNPESTRPWQHVLDPLTGYLVAIEEAIREQENATYNFGPRESSLKVSEVVAIFQNRWNELSVSISPQEKSPYESSLLDLDSTLASIRLKWTPTLDQKVAIQKTIEWWEDNLVKGKSSIQCVDDQIKDFIGLVNFDS
jgi:CDP-glucose 4,6-dehydratase